MPSERQLSYVMRDFARTVVTDFPIQATLDHLVERIVEILEIAGAGLTVTSRGSDPGYVVAAGQFPVFVGIAGAPGPAPASTFPLRSGDQQLGALELYQSRPGPLTDAGIDAARTLADVAAAYLTHAQTRVELRESSNRTRNGALHDALTGLPNRILLLERLDHAVRRGRRSGAMAAILFVDLDRFKLINDLYGHGVGDELLVAVAERLSAALRPGDTLARMSGDEFVVLCEDLDGRTETEVRTQVDAIAARIGAAVAAPFVLSDTEVSMTASVGIAFSGRGAQLGEELLRDADTAMFQAKCDGGARHQIVDLREQHRADERASLEHDLHGAPARGELRTEYQPIVETTSGRIAGVEALLRWAHPSRGLVAPTVLVPLAERSGLITEIGQWVLEQSCADRHGWRDQVRSADLSMSVNVSAHQLMSVDYASTVAAVLAATDTDPRCVTLEMTESVFVEDSERALVVLNELKRLGVKLALDDFGTGYSSLNYLKRFPIDIVKIDQTFVADLGVDEASHAIVSAVIELAHMLGMTVVAEGVETAAQHRRLAALGCDACQGYYFARPISADALDTMIQSNTVPGNPRLPALAAAR